MGPLITCMSCLIEEGTPNLDMIEVKINEDGIYRHICSKGHITYTITQSMKFEDLFEIAISALLDEYTREAIASSTAALERFYEFCIKIFLSRNGVSLELIKEVWKLVNSQSERQLGAYYFLYLNALKQKPITLSNNSISFRNNVIHKGKIPNSQEAFEYLKEVYKCIFDTLKILERVYEKEIQMMIEENLKIKNKKILEYIEKGARINTLCGGYFLNLAVKNEVETTFEIKFEEYKKQVILLKRYLKTY
ncbi:hypothetical protein [uncultured Fusobacterium sp.]|uniref:hypothetical protein n=1 Tax=uncultured Fusobacterium sp. TaxID=159267 RepID=UPI002599D95C|nr:hypothetical protein [uncultured Fusobacterium sp.]